MKTIKTVVIIALILLGSINKINAQILTDAEFFEVDSRLGKCVYYDNMKQLLLYRAYNKIRNPSISELSTLVNKLKAIRTYYNSSHGAIMQEAKDLEIIQKHYNAICAKYGNKYGSCDDKAKTVCNQVLVNLNSQIKEYERKLGVMKQKEQEAKQKEAKDKKDKAEHLAKRKIEKEKEASLTKQYNELINKADKYKSIGYEDTVLFKDVLKQIKEKEEALSIPEDKRYQGTKEKKDNTDEKKDYNKYLTINEVKNLKPGTKLLVEKDYQEKIEKHIFKSIDNENLFITTTTIYENHYEESDYTITFRFNKNDNDAYFKQMWGILKIKLAKSDN